MPCKISSIFDLFPYRYIKESNNKFVWLDNVWIEEINVELDRKGVQYSWCYENGKQIYYITQE
jgi:hypothetical protein